MQQRGCRACRMLRASNDEYEALVEASCDPGAGAVLRAPTITQGLAPFCKDTFYGRCGVGGWVGGWVGGRCPALLSQRQSAPYSLHGGCPAAMILTRTC